MDIKVVDFESADAPKTFTDSLKETGFAVLTNHPVEDALIQEVYSEWREFLKYLGQEMDAGTAVSDAEKTSQEDGGTLSASSSAKKNASYLEAAAEGKKKETSAGEAVAAPTSSSHESNNEENRDSGKVSKDIADNISKNIDKLEQEVSPASVSTADASPAETLKIDVSKVTSAAAAEKTSGIDEPLFSCEAFRKTLAEAVRKGALLSLADKYHFNPTTQDGYFPIKIAETAKGAKVKDLKHYFHLYFPHGRYPEEVSRRARVLGDKMIALGKTLVKWIDDNMSDEIRAKLPANMQQKKRKVTKNVVKKVMVDGVETEQTEEQTVEEVVNGGGLSRWVSCEQTLFRILHYPSYKDGEEAPGAVRAAAHEDINCITLLPAGSTRGLQVRSKQSGTWYEVPCIQGSLIINIGDMLQEATGGEYISTTHRVVKPEVGGSEDGSSRGGSQDGSPSKSSGKVIEDRMATPCFIHFKPETYLSEKYPTAKLFLDERLRELGVLK